MQMKISFVTLALALSVSAASLPQGVNFSRRAAVDLQNGQDAINLNNQFKTLTASSPCTAPENACVGGKFAQCVAGKFAILGCGAGTICGALPNAGTSGTTVTCTTAADLEQRIAATGATAGGANGGAQAGGAKGGASASAVAAPPASTAASTVVAPPPPASTAASTAAAPPASTLAPPTAETGANNGGASADAQTSLTLDPAVIAKGFANDGQDVPTAGQVASLTSTNNFINFCLTSTLPLTNGQQIIDGSCNPAPMGLIPAKPKMPSSKFVFPANGGTVPANTPFTIQMAITNLETGNFVNAASNYFSAPQQLNAQGLIRGHSHVVAEVLSSLNQTTPTDPTKFAFFKGLNAAAEGGILTADVPAPGLPAGAYKLSSINTAANHQPVLVPVAQHGSLDDAVYFTAV